MKFGNKKQRKHLEPMSLEFLKKSLKIVRERYFALTDNQSDFAWELQGELEALAKEIRSRESQPKPINYYAITMAQDAIEWDGGTVPHHEKFRNNHPEYFFK